MAAQCRLEFGCVVRAREAEHQFHGHRVAPECDGLHSLRLSQGLGKIGVGIRV